MLKFVSTFVLLLLSLWAFAQRVILVEGDLQNLRNIKSVKTQFSYARMMIGVDVPEAQYVAEKKIVWDQKEAGQGDAWKEMWFGDRKKKYEPIFRHFFNEATGINTKDSTSAVTLIFHTVRTEPGWSGGVIGTPANIDADVWFVDSADPSKLLARFRLENCEGIDYNGGDFEASRRTRQAYMSAGTLLGKYIRNRMKKSK
jgi:hypothetical protein